MTFVFMFVLCLLPGSVSARYFLAADRTKVHFGVTTLTYNLYMQQRGCLVAVGYMKLSNLTTFRGLRSHIFRANGVPQPTSAPYSGDLVAFIANIPRATEVENHTMHALEGVEVAEMTGPWAAFSVCANILKMYSQYASSSADRWGSKLESASRLVPCCYSP